MYQPKLGWHSEKGLPISSRSELERKIVISIAFSA